jgi:hypothetical protein
MRRAVWTAVVAVLLVAAALFAVRDSLSGAPRWSPDGLFYQAKVYELRGAGEDVALARAFEGPLGERLRQIDPDRSGSPAWVAYNARFYERRLTMPLAAAGLQPVAGVRSILDISLAGYVVAVLGIFGLLLLLRFRLPVVVAATLATIFLPALTKHSTYPLTDSWGLALETGALAFGVLALERGRRWLIPWATAILVLSFTRDSTWIPVLAALILTLYLRSRIVLWLFTTGLAAALPSMLAVRVPMRELLAQMVNTNLQPAPDASWWFVAQRYPRAIVELLQADGGYVRDGAWYSAAYLIVGLAALFFLTRGAGASAGTQLLKAGAVVGAVYVLVVPVFSAFRLELVVVPMAALGLAVALERLRERVPLASLPGLRAPAIPPAGS